MAPSKVFVKYVYAFTALLLMVLFVVLAGSQKVYAAQELQYGSLPYEDSLDFPTVYEHHYPTEANEAIQTYYISLNDIVGPTTGSIDYTIVGDECLVAPLGGSYGSSGMGALQGGDYATFTVMAANDEDDDEITSCLVTHIANVADGDFNEKKISFTVSVFDNDGSSEVVLKPLGGNQVVREKEVDSTGFGKFAYEVIVDDAPSADVAITATTDGGCMFLSENAGIYSHAGSEATLMFNQDVQGAVQKLYVGGIDNKIVEGDRLCRISHSASTSDVVYSSGTIEDMFVGIIDDDSFLPVPEEEAVEVVPSLGLLDPDDANADTILDKDQTNVDSEINVVTGTLQAMQITTLDGELSDCSTISKFVSEPEVIGYYDPNFLYPLGLYDTRIECTSIGQEVLVTLILDNLYPNAYDHTLLEFFNNRFIGIDSFETGEFAVQRGTVTAVQYRVTDGGPGDADRIANGAIVGLIGLGFDVSAPEVGNSDLDMFDTNDHIVQRLGLQLSVAALVIVLIPVIAAGMFLFTKKSKILRRKV